MLRPKFGALPSWQVDVEGDTPTGALYHKYHWVDAPTSEAAQKQLEAQLEAEGYVIDRMTIIGRLSV